jgi:hypothetical protein
MDVKAVSSVRVDRPNSLSSSTPGEDERLSTDIPSSKRGARRPVPLDVSLPKGTPFRSLLGEFLILRDDVDPIWGDAYCYMSANPLGPICNEDRPI